MNRTVFHTASLLSLAVAFTGCSSELSHDEAIEALAKHFAEIAPSFVEESPPQFVVLQVLHESEYARSVRFEASFGDQPEPLTATAGFQKSDRGWALAEYGPNLVPQIAYAVASHRWARYQDLVTTLDTLNAAGFGWFGSLSDSMLADLDARRVNSWRRRSGEQKVGPSAEVFRELVAAQGGGSIPESVEWEYRPGEPSVAPMLVARHVSTPDSACAMRFFSLGAAMPPLAFGRVEDFSTAYCRVDQPYLTSFEETIVALTAEAAVGLMPASPTAPGG